MTRGRGPTKPWRTGGGGDRGLTREAEDDRTVRGQGRHHHRGGRMGSARRPCGDSSQKELRWWLLTSTPKVVAPCPRSWERSSPSSTVTFPRKRPGTS